MTPSQGGPPVAVLRGVGLYVQDDDHNEVFLMKVRTHHTLASYPGPTRPGYEATPYMYLFAWMLHYTCTEIFQVILTVKVILTETSTHNY